jgi:hypothetical protein
MIFLLFSLLILNSMYFNYYFDLFIEARDKRVVGL